MKTAPDAWQHVLEALEPEYHYLKKVMIDDPLIRMYISKRKDNRWYAWLEQDFIDYLPDNYNSFKFDKVVNWVNQNIKNWSTAQQENYNLWSFDSQQQAEKFLTLYLVSWDQ